MKTDSPGPNDMGAKKKQERGGKGAGFDRFDKGKPGKNKGRGKGEAKKGRGKGDGKKGMRPKLNRTPDGQPICFKYNNNSGGCDGRCGMLHACQYCLLEDCAAYKCKVAKS